VLRSLQQRFVTAFLICCCIAGCRRESAKAPQKSIAWNFDVGSQSVSQAPALASDGTIYVGTHSGLIAISADGTRKWKSAPADIISGPVIASDENIYVPDLTGTVRVYQRNGEEVWRSPTEIHARAVAAAKNGTVYVLGSHLLALAPDHSTLWTSEQVFEADAKLSINSEGLAIVASAGNVFVYRPDGRLWWKATVKDIHHFTGAAVGKNDLLYFGSDNGVLYALYNNGETKWAIGLAPSLDFEPAIDADGNVYIGADMLNVVNSEGKTVRGFPVHITSTPALAADGTVILTSDDGHVYSVRTDGSEKWETDTHQHLESPPSIASDGTVYVVTREGRLLALADDNGGLMDSPWPKFRRDITNTAAE
jgi:outer membrane protein assembly factor BamB